MSIQRFIPELGETLPRLGFGPPRLPMTKSGFTDEVYEMIDYAIEHGVNYFDAGWMYCNGQAESLINEALVKRYPRSSFFAVLKLPYNLSDMSTIKEIFCAQIEHLGSDYIDVYLLRALNGVRWEVLYKLGIVDFLREKREQGIIHHIGFSFHDNYDTLKRILTDVPPATWDVV